MRDDAALIGLAAGKHRLLPAAAHPPRLLGLRSGVQLTILDSDPPLPRPRRPPRAPSRARRGGRTSLSTSANSPSTPPPGSARRSSSSTSLATSVSPGSLSGVLFERGWEEQFEGEIAGVIPSGVFVRFGDVPDQRSRRGDSPLGGKGRALAGRPAGVIEVKARRYLTQKASSRSCSGCFFCQSGLLVRCSHGDLCSAMD
jgi:hypothetical protein